MKKIFSLSLAAAAAVAAVGLSSCGNSSENAQTAFNAYTKSNTYTLVGSAADFGSDADVTVNDSVAIVLPITLGGHDVQALRDTIMARAFNVGATSIENAINQYMTTASQQYGYKTAAANVASDQVDGFQRVKGQVVNLTPSVMSYVITTSSYQPNAANGLETKDYINYSLKDNKFLTLADLFTEEGLQQLPAAIAEQAQANPVYTEVVVIEALPQSGNFYLSSEDEIVFSYQPMEVGPHYLGNVQVAFYPAELVKFMTPAAIRMFELQDLVAAE